MADRKVLRGGIHRDVNRGTDENLAWQNGPNKRQNPEIRGVAEETSAPTLAGDVQLDVKSPAPGTRSSSSSSNDERSMKSSTTGDEEMARLKRDSNILSCLPDPVIVCFSLIMISLTSGLDSFSLPTKLTNTSH